MEKKMNNKGFSLVELIIVVAIMAVLIGVLAPAYLQYVEKSKKTADCSAVGSVMDAIEIIAADPGIIWTDEALTVEFDDTGATYDCTVSAVEEQMARIVPGEDCILTGTWQDADFNFSATKDEYGNVAFSGPDADGIAEIKAISPKLANRYE